MMEPTSITQRRLLTSTPSTTTANTIFLTHGDMHTLPPINTWKMKEPSNNLPENILTRALTWREVVAIVLAVILALPTLWVLILYLWETLPKLIRRHLNRHQTFVTSKQRQDEGEKEEDNLQTERRGDFKTLLNGKRTGGNERREEIVKNKRSLDSSEIVIEQVSESKCKDNLILINEEIRESVDMQPLDTSDEEDRTDYMFDVPLYIPSPIAELADDDDDDAMSTLVPPVTSPSTSSIIRDTCSSSTQLWDPAGRSSALPYTSYISPTTSLPSPTTPGDDGEHTPLWPSPSSTRRAPLARFATLELSIEPGLESPGTPSVLRKISGASLRSCGSKSSASRFSTDGKLACETTSVSSTHSSELL